MAIRIEELVGSDIGRRVVYRGRAGETEQGVIKSWNGKIVFVRYGLTGSAATNPQDLEFIQKPHSGKSFGEILGNLASPLTAREVLASRETIEYREPDPTRCLAGTVEGRQCALDRGHYRGTDSPNPSPHCDESGVEWFGVRPPAPTTETSQ